ncbi:MAG: AbrB/MazE/SpoVT family DNA-binding domain-containing protein [Candidatus Bipolaricaulota bacterium]|nr:AbrB/MazE/SpoVT family DNA-binding domain-containing protein [Candidatus Bipolaricaulota bacterium]
MSRNMTRLRATGQVTIPKRIREALHLKPGDLLHVVLDDGCILLIPESAIDPDQAWFWTKEWQKGEREADEDIRAGRTYGPFDSVKEMMKHFEAIKDELDEEDQN